MQRRLFCILHISQILGHDPVEDRIDTVKHRCTASEILMQFYLLITALLRSISLIFFHEQLRACQTELVNALFHIAYHEHVRTAKPLSR